MLDHDEFDPGDPHGIARRRGPESRVIMDLSRPQRSPRVLVVSFTMLGVLESAGVDRDGIIPALDPNVPHFESERPLSRRAKRRQRGKSK